MKFTQSSLIFFAALLGNVLQIFALSLCPPKGRIAPCTCSQYGTIQIICQGSNKDKISQQLLLNVISSLRDVNNVSSDSNEWLHLPEFYLSHTNLSIVDLSPFIKIKFSQFHIKFCGSLTKIVGPGSQFHGLIDVEHLDLSHNSLTDQGLGDVLKYFKADSMNTIKLHNNELQLQLQLQTSAEVLPGLCSFNNLEDLLLNNNKITRVTGGQFKQNKNLRNLFLNSNKIGEIGHNAFELNPPDSGLDFEGELIIDLSGNGLSDANISSAHGLDRTHRPTRVRFQQNNFTYISEGNFESYLNHGKYSHKLNFEENPINCEDERMLWLMNMGKKLEFGEITGIPCIIFGETTGNHSSDAFTISSSSPQKMVGNLNPFKFCALLYAVAFLIQEN